MFRYLFLLIGMLTILPAADEVSFFHNLFPVYVIGDASGVANMFNFLAMVLNHSVTETLVFIGVVVALVRVFLSAGKKDLGLMFKEFVWIIAIFAFFLAPNSSVVVKDGRVENGTNVDLIKAQEYGYVALEKVDNVPIGIALITSFASTVNWELANLLETIVAPVGLDFGPSVGITHAGFNQPAKDMRWLVTRMTDNTKSENFDIYLSEYVEKCALPTVDVDPRNATKIKNPPGGDFQTYLSPSQLPVAGTQISDPLNRNNHYDCSEYWDNFLGGEKSIAYNDALYNMYLEHKEYSASGIPSNEYNDYLRKIISSEVNTEIASFKDTIGALKRAAVIGGALNASGTGLTGIDASNRIQMTEAKQGMMIQGAANFAWLGEMLPQGINIAFGFIVAMSALMALFLLYQGWINGIKVILNYTAGVFALCFSYVSLAVTQGFVNHWAAKNAIEQYKAAGSSLQIDNYDYMLEQVATMQGVAGVLGITFVALGVGLVFYGEVKGITNAIMGKIQGAYAGNNLDEQFKDNVNDIALTDSIAQARKDRMAKELTEAGIPFDGGNIEYHFAGLQQQIAELGSARGAHFGIDSREERDDLYAGSALQSFEKSKNTQGHGAEVTNATGGELTPESFELVAAASFTEGRAGAADLMGKNSLLEDPSNADSFVEAGRRSGIIQAAKGIGMGKAVPQDEEGKPMSMEDYAEAVEEQSALDMIMQGEKALAAKRFTNKGSYRDGDGVAREFIAAKEEMAIGAHRAELGNLSATMAKGMLVDENNTPISNDDYLIASMGNSLKRETEGYMQGKTIAGVFGDDFKNFVTMTPSAKPGDISPALGFQDDPISLAEDSIKEETASGLIQKFGKSEDPEQRKKINNALNKEDGKLNDISEALGLSTDEDKRSVQKYLNSSGIGVDQSDGGLLFEHAINKKLANRAKEGMLDFLDWHGENVKGSENLSELQKSILGTNIEQLKNAVSKAPSLKDISLGSFEAAGIMPQVLEGMGFKLKSEDGATIVTGIDNKALATLNTNDNRIDTESRPLLREGQRKENSSPLPGVSTDSWNDYRAALATRESKGSGDLKAENQYGYIGRYQFGADALADTGLIDTKKWKDAKKKKIGQKRFLNDESNWTIPGGKDAFMGENGYNRDTAEDYQEKALAKLTRQNFNTLKKAGIPVGEGNSDYTTGLMAVSHLLGAGNGIKFAKGGITPVDGNGTTAASYYETGARGKIGTGAHGIQNSGVGGGNLAAIASGHARKDIESWIGGGLASNEALSRDPSIFRQNSYVGEMSKTLGSKADIDAKGGIAGAINTNVSDQALKASKMRGAVESEVAAIGRANGMSPADASKFAQEIMNGFRSGTQLHKQGILEAARMAAGIQSGKKTEKDQRETQEFAAKYGADFDRKGNIDPHNTTRKDGISKDGGDVDLAKSILADKKQTIEIENNKSKGISQIHNDKNGQVIDSLADWFGKGNEKKEIQNKLHSSSIDSDGNIDIDKASQVISDVTGKRITGKDIQNSAENYLFGENSVNNGWFDGSGVINTKNMAKNEFEQKGIKSAEDFINKHTQNVADDNSLSNDEKNKRYEAFKGIASKINSGEAISEELAKQSGLSQEELKGAGIIPKHRVKNGLNRVDFMFEPEVAAEVASMNASKEVRSLKEQNTPEAIQHEISSRKDSYVALKEAAKEQISQGNITPEYLAIANDKDGQYFDKIVNKGEPIENIVSNNVAKNGAMVKAIQTNHPDNFNENSSLSSEQANQKMSASEKKTNNQAGLEEKTSGLVDLAKASMVSMDEEKKHDALDALKKEGLVTPDSTIGNIKEITQPETKEITASASYGEVAKSLAKKSVQEELGAGLGAINNLEQSPNIYAQNAMYGEMSHAQTTAAKIDTQQGVQAAVGTDVGESAMKAASQQGGVFEQTKQLAKAEGYSDAAAEAIAKAMTSGGATAASLIQSGITGAAGNIAAAKSGSQTAGEAESIKQYGGGNIKAGVEGFIEGGKIESAKRAITQKAQNLDLANQDQAQNFINDIDNEVLSRQSPQERAEMVGILKDVGMITQDSTVGNLKATNGEQFAIAQAHLAAGAMSRSERMAIGDVSLSTVRDVTSGHARIEARKGNIYADGDEVNHNQGVSWKNPIQYGLDKSSIADTSSAGTDDGTFLDEATEIGANVIKVGSAALMAKGVDSMTGGYGQKALQKTKRKAFGQKPIRDNFGNEDWVNPKEQEVLKQNGMITEDGKGGYKLNDGYTIKDANQKIHSSKDLSPKVSVGATKNSTTAQTTTPANNIAKVSMNNSLLKDSVSDNTNTTNYSENSTKSQENIINDNKDSKNNINSNHSSNNNSKLTPMKKLIENGSNLSSLNEEELRQAAKSMTEEQNKIAKIKPEEAGKQQIIFDLDNATKDVDISTSGGAMKKELASTLKDKINNGMALNQGDADLFNALTDKKLPVTQSGTVSISKYGHETKNQAFNALEDMKRMTIKEQGSRLGGEDLKQNGSLVSDETPKQQLSANDNMQNGTQGEEHKPLTSHTPGTKKGKLLSWALTAFGVGGMGYGILGTEADASSPPRILQDELPINSHPSINSADSAALWMSGAFNTVNTIQAGLEMKGGASRNIQDLAHFKNYASGAKGVAADMIDFGVKGGAKGLGEMALKKLPGVGLALGAGLAIDRASDGDYIGASMELASGALSLIPGIGTAASVAIDATLMARDYQAAQESTTLQSKNTLSSNQEIPTNTPAHQDGHKNSINSQNNTTPVPDRVGQNTGEKQSSFENLALSSSQDNSTKNTNDTNSIGSSFSNESAQRIDKTQTNLSASNKMGNNVDNNTNIISDASTNNILSPKENMNILEEENNPTVQQRVSKLKSLNNSIQQMSNMDAGENYIGAITNDMPSGLQEAISMKASSGTLTPKNLRTAGVSEELVQQMPLTSDGVVDISSTGAQYKSGLSNLVGIQEASASPIEKFGGGIVNNLEKSNLSSVASSVIMDSGSIKQSATHIAPSTMGADIVSSSAPQIQSAGVAHANVSQAQTTTTAMQNISDIMNNPGNLYTPNSAVRDSIKDVEGKLGNVSAQVPSNVAFNKEVLGDMLNGIATTAPIQTQGGEVTLAQSNGNLSFGFGQNSIETKIPYDTFRQMSSPQQDQFVSTLSSSNLNNGMINGAGSSNDTNWRVNSQETSEQILSDIKRSGDVGQIDDRLYAEETISYLEDLVEEMESMKEITLGDKVG